MARPVSLADRTQVFKGASEHCPCVPAEEEACTSLQYLVAPSFLILLVMLTTAVLLAASVVLAVFFGKC